MSEPAKIPWPLLAEVGDAKVYGVISEDAERIAREVAERFHAENPSAYSGPRDGPGEEQQARGRKP